MNIIANNICKKLIDAGFKAYFVGGCVRDYFMDTIPHDIDITTDATPDKIQELFPNHVNTGIKHGTVSVRLGNNELFEVTTFRVDGKYDDGRHPDNVIFVCNVEDDLARRDFTINAIAYNPITKELVDPFNGKNDIKNKMIRAVGNAKDRFMEDPLRILRAMRFAIRFGFIIEPNTAVAMHDTEVLARLGECISKERITEELRKMLTCNKPVHNIFMEFSDVLNTLFPDMIPMHTPHNSPWHKHDIFEHSICVIDACNTERFDIKLAAMFHDIGKPACRTIDENDPTINHFKGHPSKSVDICKIVFNRDLRLSNKEKETILSLISIHDIVINPSDKNIRKMIINYGEDVVRAWIILKGADLSDHISPADKIDKFDNALERFNNFKQNIDSVINNMNAFTIKDLAINGSDIMNIFGIPAGPIIGDILNVLFDAVTNEIVSNNKQNLLNFITIL